jgi:hypothetical protein
MGTFRDSALRFSEVFSSPCENQSGPSYARCFPGDQYPSEMTQLDVSLTDYGLAAECVWFSFLMTRLRTANASSLPLLFTAFFFSIAIAAAAGGTVHGFFLDESSRGYRILWPFTLIVVGLTALFGMQIGSALQFSRFAAAYINRGALAIFMAYCVLVLFVRRDFSFAILDYVPALVFLGVTFLLAYRRRNQSRLLIGFIGVCTMLFAAAAQQAKIGIHPVYFDHNALYHVIQGIALFMVFLAARESSKSAESGK